MLTRYPGGLLLELLSRFIPDRFDGRLKLGGSSLVNGSLDERTSEEGSDLCVDQHHGQKERGPGSNKNPLERR